MKLTTLDNYPGHKGIEGLYQFIINGKGVVIKITRDKMITITEMERSVLNIREKQYMVSVADLNEKTFNSLINQASTSDEARFEYDRKAALIINTLLK